MQSQLDFELLSILRVDDRALSLVALSDARVSLFDPPRQIPEPHRDRRFCLRGEVLSFSTL